MSFQIPRALLFKVARPAARVAGRNVGRRAMSTAPHGAHVSSDKPWIIGSALVFGPAFAYLVSPPGQKKAHEAKEAALPKHIVPDPARAPIPEPEGAANDEASATPSANDDSAKVAEYAEEETSKRAQSETNEAAQGTGFDASVAQHADTEHKDDTSALETSHKTPRDIGGARERATSGLDPNTSAQVDAAVGEEDKKDAKLSSDESTVPSTEKSSE